MLEMFDGLRQMTLLSVGTRLLLAVLCGGLIGLEREYKRRPAGFRTHILICLGASLTTLTSQYLTLSLGYYTDMARMGAQVVAGIGFIGAGTIIVTKQQRVKGLTTAAGLWASAIVGLAIGAGFYEGAVVAVLLILLAEMLFVKLEYRILRNSREYILYIEYKEKSNLERILAVFREWHLHIRNMEITRAEESERHNASAIFYVRAEKKTNTEKMIAQLHKTEGVLGVEEL